MACLTFSQPFWASFTSDVCRDSHVHGECRGPDAPCLGQAILHWMPTKNSWCNHAAMQGKFGIMCIFSSLSPTHWYFWKFLETLPFIVTKD